MTTEELNNLHIDLHCKYVEIRDFAIKKITALLNHYLPKYKVETLSDNLIRLTPTNKVNTRFYDIEIYFGEDSWAKEKGFKYEINPSSIGSFSIIDNGDNTGKIDYYASIATILTNETLHENMLIALKSFHYEIMPLVDQMYDIAIIKRNREYEKRVQELKQVAREEFQSTYDAIIDEQAQGNANDLYVVMYKSGANPNAIYRKKEVKIMPYGVGTYSDMVTARGKNSKNRYDMNNMVIVSTSKIKLLPLE
jgi:hypothetical protein